jgi:toxin FitB
VGQHLWRLAKPDPDGSVLTWIARQRRVDLCTTAISEAELAYGLALLPKGRRRDALTQAVARLLGEGLGGRVLAFDRIAAAAYGEIAAGRRAAGRPVATADAQIAAIARARGAALLATRDVGGFQNCGVPLIDRWRPSPVSVPGVQATRPSSP